MRSVGTSQCTDSQTVKEIDRAAETDKAGETDRALETDKNGLI